LQKRISIRNRANHVGLKYRMQIFGLLWELGMWGTARISRWEKEAD